MSARSNFKEVRLRSSGLSLHVTGESDIAPTEVFASVVHRPAGDDRVDPRTEKTGAAGKGAIVADWELDIAIERDEFKPGDHVLLAGAALRGADTDVWVDNVRILPLPAPPAAS